MSIILSLSNNLYSFYFVMFIPIAILVVLELRKIIIYFSNKEDK
jgi:hypothetical protein